MKFQELLENGTFAVSSEILVPSGTDAQSVSQTHFDSMDWADMLRVKVNPRDRAGNKIVSACRTLAKNGVPLELEVRTHNVNRLEIAKLLIDASDAGVDNFLIFAQDYWISGDSMREMMYFHTEMGKFFSAADALSRGYDVDGQQLDGEKHVFVGAGIDPQFGEHAPDLQVREMEKLAEHGVRYFVTKPIFDPDKLSGFVDKVSRLNVPVIAEVLMLQSAAEALLWHSLSWINVPPPIIEKLEKADKSSDAAVSITMEIVERVKKICAGVHLLPYGNVAKIAREIKSSAP